MKPRRTLMAAMADERGVIKRQSTGKPIIKLYEDGTLLRIDVRADLAKPLTVQQAWSLIHS